MTNNSGLPARIELPGDFYLTPKLDGTYALFGGKSSWQIGAIGVEAIKSFAAAMNQAEQPTQSDEDVAREILQSIGTPDMSSEKRVEKSVSAIIARIRALSPTEIVKE